jgi:hypothetical protein
VQLADGAAALPIAVDSNFWQRIGEDTALQEGRLVTFFHLDRSNMHWEMHPAGDEILFLVSMNDAEDDMEQALIEIRGLSRILLAIGLHRSEQGELCGYIGGKLDEQCSAAYTLKGLMAKLKPGKPVDATPRPAQ